MTVIICLQCLRTSCRCLTVPLDYRQDLRLVLLSHTTTMTQLKMYRRNAQQAQQPDAAVNTHSSAVPVMDKRHEAAASAIDSSSATEKPSRHSSRPVTALLSGHRELAELISNSSSRYAEHLQAPSLEPSADVLQGVFCWHGAPCSCCPCQSP